MMSSPIPASSIGSPTTHLLELAAAKPGAAAMIYVRSVDVTHTVTRGELAQDIVGGAQCLLGMGIRRGDMVLLVLENDYSVARWFLAAIHAGAVPAILPNAEQAAANADRVRRVVNDIGFSLVIAENKWGAGLAAGGVDGACRITTLDNLERSEKMPLPASEARPSDPMYLQFTTGTTASCKAARLSYGAMWAYARSLGERLGFQEGEVVVSWAPFSHPMALTIVLWGPIFAGGTSVFIPPRLWLRQPVLLMAVVSRFGATAIAMPNFGFRHCLERIRESDMSGLSLASLKHAVNSSELVQWPVVDAFCQRFSAHGMPAEAVRAAYGMSEYAGIISLGELGRRAVVDWVSAAGLRNDRAVPVAPEANDAYPVVGCGPLLRDARVQIRDDSGNQMEERGLGEIMLQGPALFDGYCERTGIEPARGGDGWFRTGDLGYFVGDELFVTGRKRDVIVTAGRKTSAENVEAIAGLILGDRGHGMAAFGVVDPNLGTEVAVLVCERAAAPELPIWDGLEQTIRTKVTAELAIMLAEVRFVSRGWLVRHDLKVSRAESRTKYLAENTAKAQPVAVTGAHPLQRMTALFQEVLHRNDIKPDDNFFEVGGDSLAASRLVHLIEQEFKVEVPLSFYDTPTVAAAVELAIGGPAGEVSVPAFPAAAAPLPGPKPAPAVPPEDVPAHVVWRRRVEHPCFRLPYRSGVKLLGLWLRLAPVQRFLYPEETGLFRATHRDLGISGECSRKLIANNLAGNVMLEHRTREERIRIYPPLSGKSMQRETVRLRFWRDVTELIDDPTGRKIMGNTDVEGRDHLAKALQRPAGTGLVLVIYHHTGMYFSPAVVRQLIPGELLPMAAGEARDLQLAANPTSTPADFIRERGRWFAALAHQGFQVLSKGGTVAVAAQYRYDNDNCVPVSVGGRIRPTKKGLAELALRSGAWVLPMAAGLRSDGRHWVAFHPLLPIPPSDLSLEERIRRLTGSAATSVDASWRMYPEGMRWNEQREQGKLPRAEAGVQPR